jgi:hypothetical protein
MADLISLNLTPLARKTTHIDIVTKYSVNTIANAVPMPPAKYENGIANVIFNIAEISNILANDLDIPNGNIVSVPNILLTATANGINENAFNITIDGIYFGPKMMWTIESEKT